MKKAKKQKPKEVHHELIERDSLVGESMYAVLDSLLAEQHGDRDLGDVRIALAWCTSWKPDADGRLTLGMCKKATDLDRELAPFDFVILLNRDFWQDLRVSGAQRRALLDHELMHAAVKYDESGEPVVDTRGRTVYRVRQHDIEEFADIVRRHGCYKRDLETFAEALESARFSPRTWAGYTEVQQRLMHAGISLPIDVIVRWSEVERREAGEWATLQADLEARGNAALPMCPAHVTAATAEQSSADAVA